MPAQRVAGVCYFKIDGVQLSLRGSAKVDVSTVKREAIVNLDRSINSKEMPKEGTMELELTTVPGVSVQALNSITNAVVTFEAANGTVYALQGAFQVDDLNVDVDEGKVQVKFAGVPIEFPSLG